MSRRLRAGEWIAGGGAVALIGALWLPWYEAGGARSTGWQAFAVLDLVLLALALVPLALVVAQATRESPAIPVCCSVLALLAGTLATLLVAYRVVAPPASDAALQPGAWLGLVATLALVAGAWRSMRAEQTPGRALPPIAEQPLPAPAP